MTDSLQDAVGLTAILQRVEGLTSPDREVDALLTVAFDVRPEWCVGYGELWVDLKSQIGEPVIRINNQPNKMPSQGNPPMGPYAAYTASLDAALALVERCLRPLHPGMTLTLKAIYSGSREPYWYAEITWPSSERQGRATTPAIALLGALMRSLEQ